MSIRSASRWRWPRARGTAARRTDDGLDPQASNEFSRLLRPWREDGGRAHGDHDLFLSKRSETAWNHDHATGRDLSTRRSSATPTWNTSTSNTCMRSPHRFLAEPPAAWVAASWSRSRTRSCASSRAMVALVDRLIVEACCSRRCRSLCERAAAGRRAPRSAGGRRTRVARPGCEESPCAAHYGSYAFSRSVCDVVSTRCRPIRGRRDQARAHGAPLEGAPAQDGTARKPSGALSMAGVLQLIVPCADHRPRLRCVLAGRERGTLRRSSAWASRQGVRLGARRSGWQRPLRAAGAGGL